jgi:ABC-2 type transport system permease protein
MLVEQIRSIADRRIFALILKELRQILRNRQLVFLLLFPPTVQIVLYGFALSPDVQNLRLGVIDESKTTDSRELISALVENHVLDLCDSGGSEKSLVARVKRGNLDAGLIIPPEFNRQIREQKTAKVQVMLDGVDANTAGIANGYITQMIQRFAAKYLPIQVPQPVQPDITYIYNPGLVSAWFFVPGVMGLVLTLTGSLVSSATLVREKDTGTLEQLMMTPAESWEILVAKIVPLFFLLYLNVFFALFLGSTLFNLPFRGNFFLYVFVSGVYIFVCIAIGIVLATISSNQRQAILTSFFINLPLIQLSGALAPLESVVRPLQWISYLNPLRYYIECIRNILLRGVGLDVIWPNVLILVLFSAVFLFSSAYRFRRQLG